MQNVSTSDAMSLQSSVPTTLPLALLTSGAGHNQSSSLSTMLKANGANLYLRKHASGILRSSATAHHRHVSSSWSRQAGSRKLPCILRKLTHRRGRIYSGTRPARCSHGRREDRPGRQDRAQQRRTSLNYRCQEWAQDDP